MECERGLKILCHKIVAYPISPVADNAQLKGLEKDHVQIFKNKHEPDRQSHDINHGSGVMEPEEPVQPVQIFVSFNDRCVTDKLDKRKDESDTENFKNTGNKTQENETKEFQLLIFAEGPEKGNG